MVLVVVVVAVALALALLLVFCACACFFVLRSCCCFGHGLRGQDVCQRAATSKLARTIQLMICPKKSAPPTDGVHRVTLFQLMKRSKTTALKAKPPPPPSAISWPQLELTREELWPRHLSCSVSRDRRCVHKTAKLFSSSPD